MKIREGDDDEFEGLAGTPLEAVRILYKSFKDFIKNPPEDNEEI